MKKRKFGPHQDMLSVIGLGGISIKNEGQKKADNIVRHAYDKGVNYFDVAPGYGDAQKLMGKSLLGFRNDIFLACKTSSRDQKGSQEDLEKSLKLLNTEYFDLYQLHGMKTQEDFEKVTATGGALQTLIDAKKNGKVRYLGFSCHSIKVAHLLLDNFEFDSILFPVNWALILKSGFGPEILEKANNNNVAVLALKVMADTLWEDNNEREFEKCWYKPLNNEKMIDLSIKYALSQNIVSFLPPGDHDLFSKGLNAVLNYQTISREESIYLKKKARHSSPIGSKHEIFLGKPIFTEGWK